MSSIEEIEEAIAALAPGDLARFRAWFDAFDAAHFDARIERDAASGKLDALAEQALAGHRKGVSAMNGFIATTRANPRIPVITVRELVDALAQFLATFIDYSHEFETIECDRSEKCTSISMFGGILPDFEFQGRTLSGIRRKVLIDIGGKAASTKNAKLWAEPFVVTIHINLLDTQHFDVLIEPLPDRLIAIRRVLRWESGKPIAGS